MKSPVYTEWGRQLPTWWELCLRPHSCYRILIVLSKYSAYWGYLDMKGIWHRTRTYKCWKNEYPSSEERLLYMAIWTRRKHCFSFCYFLVFPRIEDVWLQWFHPFCGIITPRSLSLGPWPHSELLRWSFTSSWSTGRHSNSQWSLSGAL